MQSRSQQYAIEQAFGALILRAEAHDHAAIAHKAGLAHLHTPGGSPELASSPEFAELIRKQGKRRQASRFQCSLPAMLGGCNESAIRSHSVQRGGGLTHLAESGKVRSCVDFTRSALITALDPSPKLLGVKKQASVFPGFCSSHDTALFRDAEVDGAQPTRRVAASLHLRALLFERWCKEHMRADDLLEHLEQKQWASEEERDQVLAPIRFQNRQGELGVEDAEVDLSVVLATGLDGIESHLNSLVIGVQGSPNVAACGCFCPQFTRKGRTLYDLESGDSHGPKLSVNVVPVSSNASNVFLSWSKQEDEKMRPFAYSCLQYPKRSLGSALFTLAIDHVENVHFRPSFWDGLRDDEQRTMLGHLHNGGHNGLQNGRSRIKAFGMMDCTGVQDLS